MKNLKLFAFLVVLMVFVFDLTAQNYGPGTDIVGYGYNVFGDYANQKSKNRYCLFTYGDYRDVMLGNTTFQVPENVILENISEHIIKTVSGSSMREYAKSLSAKAGLEVDAFFFSGSVNSSYNSSSKGMQKKFYFTYMDANTKYRISLDIRGDDIDPLKKMLESRFKKDLEEMEPALLFQTYGTHYIASAYLGGRADFTSETVMTTSTKTSDLEVAVEAKYKAVSANSEMQKKHSETLSKNKTKTNLRVVGGNSEFANNINDPETYAKWAEGIASMPVLCDFDKGGLRPIWEFATSERQKVLKAAFNELLKSHPLPEAIASAILLKDQVYFVRSMEYSDLYWDLSGFHFDAEQKRGKIKLYGKDNHKSKWQGADRFIKVIPHPSKHEYVFLQPQHSDYVADISGGVKTPGAELQLWSMGKDNEAQMFKMVEVSGKKSTYYLVNAKSELYLTAHGKSKPITQEKKNRGLNQQWVFEAADGVKQMAPPSTGKVYAIQNLKAKRYIDVPGAAPNQKRKGAKLTLWDMDGGPDRYFKLQGTSMDDFFYIQPKHSTEVWDIQGKSKDNGADLQLYTKNNTANQQFKFVYAGEPMTYFIVDRNSGKYIDASNSNIDRNGCPVQIWSKNNKDNQKWKLKVYNVWQMPPKDQAFHIKAAYTKKYWDIGGTGKETNTKGKKFKMWDLDGGGDRKFKFLPSGDQNWIFIQVQNGGRFVDVPNNTDKKGTQLQLWDANKSDAQKFAIEFTSEKTFVIRTKHWKAIDINGGNSDDWKKNGAKLILWDLHYHKNQQFQLIYADGPNKGKVFKFKQ